MKAAVLGAGVMGHRITEVLARSGVRVCLSSRSAQTLDRARTALQADGIAAVEYVNSITDAAAEADLVIESVPESLELKRAVLAEAERSAPSDVVIATNTSSLPLESLAQALERPHRFLGLHWFNPAHLIPLVEVVPTSATEPGVVEWSLALLTELGKRPIVVPAIDGFLVNRLQYALIREALALIDQGVATPEQIDAVVTECLGPRWAVIGPMRSTDLAGIETALAVATQLYPKLSAATAPQPALARLAQDGRMGAAAGEGFYAYPDGHTVDRDRDRALAAVLEALRGAEPQHDR